MTKSSSIKTWVRRLLNPEALRYLAADDPEGDRSFAEGAAQVMDKQLDRRQALKAIAGAGAAGAALVQAACAPLGGRSEEAQHRWEEFFKKNYRLMTETERAETVTRLTKLAADDRGGAPHIQTTPAQPGVLFGYAFNISKCKGYQDCVKACIHENNLDRGENMQYIRIFEIENGQQSLASANGSYYHEVPADGHYYLGTQCFHCENPPCVDVCPVGATWKEEDGIVVVDYDWCIGCRYCQAACPYFGRRFNWSAPQVPPESVNREQHYLGNRPRKKGVMEKCTFCIQRTRQGKLPACVEACPTGARVFGNLLDPNSEIRYVLANKKVFRLKEELGTEPKFWYFTD
ncbi:4Fe-4S dicluster domain-containing protein [Acanthopleuribacter pedis]|uniref:4Fe-4S dicluster domain-containing protein n=1 Tax=Acanthopleuribacter pedis TaxID=442870 RepID=A0A8J7U2Z0_9BACT|nr:4Fe-4S dicluster domain-containing protein [Acanthopleuribacter pedis]MBO1319082.1 4Fe-4S dicluster domain-containing protein [Acanthopleuribacter pedis]